MSFTHTLSSLKSPLAVPTAVPARLRGTVWQRSWLAKAYYSGLLTFAQWASKTSITPDAITAVSLLFSVAAMSATVFGHFGFAVVLLAISGSFDLLDGAVARLTDRTSRWGALLDSTVDRLADALPLFGILFFYAPNRWAMGLVAANVLFGFTISYVRARAESLGEVLPQTFMRRAERLLVLVASLLLGLMDTPQLDALVGLPRALLLISLLIGTILNFVGAFAILVVARRQLSPVTRTSTEIPRT